MTIHTCLSCDTRVEFTSQTLEAAGGGRYRHTDWRDCQAALRWTRPNMLSGWAQAKNDDLGAARRAGALEPGDDVSAGSTATSTARRW